MRKTSYPFMDQELFRLIADRDGGCCCANCGSTSHLTIDHILPRAKGGKDVFENLQLLCKACNSAKGTKDDFGFKWSSNRSSSSMKELLYARAEKTAIAELNERESRELHAAETCEKIALNGLVKHPRFGVGVVVSKEVVGDDVEVGIEFPDGNRRVFSTRFADLVFEEDQS